MVSAAEEEISHHTLKTDGLWGGGNQSAMTFHNILQQMALVSFLEIKIWS